MCPYDVRRRGTIRTTVPLGGHNLECAHENVPTFGTSLKHDLQPRFKGLNPTFLNLFVIQEPILFFLCFPSVLLYGALDEPLLFSYPLSLWLLSLCRGFVLLAWRVDLFKLVLNRI